MPGPPPKPDHERRRNTPPALGWTDYPNTPRTDPPPPLPDDGRAWPDATRTAWAALWSLPVARAWDASGFTLRCWLEVRRLIDTGRGSAALYGELRQIEDRHGVTPKAALACRIRLVDPADAAPDTSPARRARRRDPRLRLLPPGGSAS